MRPVLLLHGALGSQSQLNPLKNALSENGFIVYSMNFSGHSGEPLASQFGIEAFSEDIVSFLKLHHLKRVDIFGYSMGGYVAMWLAYRYPEYAGKIVTLGTKFDWNIESAERELKKIDPEKILEKVPAFARILEQRHAPTDWKELLYRSAAMIKRLGEEPLLTEKILPRIKNEVLILLGDLDDVADLEYSMKVATMLQTARFVSLEKTPHPIERVDVNFLCRTLTETFRS